MKLAVIALLLILPVAHAKAPAPKPRAALGREFKIKIGQEVSLDRARLKITFAAVPQDSRCPEGVRCVWSGNAEVVLSLVTADGRDQTVTLNSHVTPKEVDFDNYRIRLIRVTPGRSESSGVDPNRYRVWLAVTRI